MKLSLYPLFAALLAVSLYSYGQQSRSASDLDSLLQAARESQQRGDDLEAARDYKQALKIRPDLAQLWANLGLVQHEQKLYAEAIASFLEARRRDPSLFVPNLFLGMDLMEIGKTSEATSYLSKATQLNPSDPQGHLALARAYRAQGRIAFAISEFEKVTAIEPRQSSAWFSLGLIYLDEVENDSRRMSEIYRDSAFAKALYAKSLVKQARYYEAIDVYKETIAETPTLPCLHSELGFVYLRLGDRNRAETEFGAEAGDGCGLAELGQSRLAIERGSYPDALATLHRLWDRGHGFVRAHISALAEGLPGAASSSFAIYLKQQHEAAEISDDLYALLSAALDGAPDSDANRGGAADAIRTGSRAPRDAFKSGRYGECVQEAEGLKTRGADQLRLLAVCEYYSGSYSVAAKAAAELAHEGATEPEGLYWAIQAQEQLALQALNRYQELEPDSERTHLLLGDIYRQRRRNDDAVREYKRALEIVPGDPAALLGLATSYLLNGNYPATVETLQPALARRPDDPEMNLVVGEALVERQQYGEAESYVRKALSAKPQVLPHVHALLGRIYANTNKPADAIQELKTGLSSDEDGSVHYQLARLYLQTGDSRDAALALEQMKVLQRKRREAAVIAVRDEPLANLDDNR